MIIHTLTQDTLNKIERNYDRLRIFCYDGDRKQKLSRLFTSLKVSTPGIRSLCKVFLNTHFFKDEALLF